MGMILLIFLFLLLLVVLWAPSLVVLRNNEIPIKSKKVVGLLLIQVIVATFIVLFSEAVGLLNPGGLTLASVLIVSAAGYFVARKFRASGS